MSVSAGDAYAQSPAGELATGIGIGQYAPASGPSAPLSSSALAPAGGGLPHNNMQPYLTFNFCIALAGVYPPRT